MGRSSPEHALNVVVFPAPLGPIRPGDPAHRRLEADVVHGEVTTEADLQVPDLQPGGPEVIS